MTHFPCPGVDAAAADIDEAATRTGIGMRKEVIMPRGDRTGPKGMESTMGRRAGYRSGSGVPGCMEPYCGRGFGRGFGKTMIREEPYNDREKS
jgi:hypothetical protein